MATVNYQDQTFHIYQDNNIWPGDGELYPSRVLAGLRLANDSSAYGTIFTALRDCGVGEVDDAADIIMVIRKLALAGRL